MCHVWVDFVLGPRVLVLPFLCIVVSAQDGSRARHLAVNPSLLALATEAEVQVSVSHSDCPAFVHFLH